LLRSLILTVGATLALLGAGEAAGGTAAQSPEQLPRGSEPVQLDPADFTTNIDNPWLPMRPGSRWVYRETEGRRSTPQRVEVTVTNQTRVVAGITARVVLDVVTRRGRLVERTFDWYAQDRAGNVWYLGEQTQEYENGRPSTRAGSWETGVGGAQAGIIMPARPRRGLTYRQEYLEGEAEDAAQVLSLNEQVQTPLRHFPRAIMTKDFTPLSPRALEHKFYARGVGLVLVLGVSGGSAREELVRYEKGRG
jgi:hypothetical protein